MGSWGVVETRPERGTGKEALGVWPVGATPLLSDQLHCFPAAFLPAAETLPLPPTTWGEMQDLIVRVGRLDSSQRPPGVWGTLYPLLPTGEGPPVWFPSLQLSSLTHIAAL